MTHRWLLLLLTALFLAACGGGGAPTINSIEVTPATASKQVGQTQQFTAVAKDASGNPISGVTFSWSSSNTSVATVDNDGLATAVAQGTATITASAGGKSGTATLTVTPIPTFTVGGEVRYLNGSGLVLALGTQTKTIGANGPFTFDTPVPDGTYTFSVQTQPTNPPQNCTVTPNSVTVSGANVTNLVVACSPYTKWLASVETDMGNAITTDASGNVIVVGQSRGVLSERIGPLALNYPDVVVAKYAPNGARLWVKQFTVGDPDTSPNAESQAKGVATDADGNIYVVGNAYVSASGASKGFILKLSPSGARLSSVKLDEATPNVENGLTGVTVVGSDVYVGGYTAGTVPGGTNAGGEDAALYKYSTSLSLQWARQFGSPGKDHITAIGVDSAGDVYAAGFASGALPGQTLLGDTDAFVVKHNSSGTQQWLSQFGTIVGGDSANALAVVGSDVYVAGYVAGPYEPGFNYNGGTDLFVTKFTSAGNETWRRQYSPTDPAKIDPYGIAADASGNVYIVGEVNASVDGIQTHNGGQDIFILQYLADGTVGWARQQGSAQDEIALAVTLRGSDLYLTGWSKGALDDYTNAGLEDIFVLKYDTSGDKK
ncbi:SBBP repeat-containing protein [Meiothermus cerbereus]|uniref:SBBP repeat-containing protein n=1 Tax=Meiothermus cerbereus TaxID=65552 RepID=UPI003EEAE0A9